MKITLDALPSQVLSAVRLPDDWDSMSDSQRADFKADALSDLMWKHVKCSVDIEEVEIGGHGNAGHPGAE